MVYYDLLHEATLLSPTSDSTILHRYLSLARQLITSLMLDSTGPC